MMAARPQRSDSPQRMPCTRTLSHDSKSSTVIARDGAVPAAFSDTTSREQAFSAVPRMKVVVRLMRVDLKIFRNRAGRWFISKAKIGHRMTNNKPPAPLNPSSPSLLPEVREKSGRVRKRLDTMTAGPKGLRLEACCGAGVDPQCAVCYPIVPPRCDFAGLSPSSETVISILARERVLRARLGVLQPSPPPQSQTFSSYRALCDRARPGKDHGGSIPMSIPLSS